MHGVIEMSNPSKSKQDIASRKNNAQCIIKQVIFIEACDV